MAFDVESQGARHARFLTFNPTKVAERPLIKISPKPRPEEVKIFGDNENKLASTGGYYHESVDHGLLRPPTLEYRSVIVLATTPDDITLLGRRTTDLVVPQIVVEDPLKTVANQTAHVWFKPVDEVMAKLNPEQSLRYRQSLEQGRIPLVGTASVSKDFFKVPQTIARDNSNYIRELGENGKPMDKVPLTISTLRGIADKYDPSTEYRVRFPGMLLDYANLSGREMLSYAVLTPAERTEFLAIVDPHQQTAYINAGVREGFKRLRVTKATDVTQMWGLLGRMRNNNPTSSNDMEQRFNNHYEVEDYDEQVRNKLLFAINLPASKIVTLAFMEPAVRLDALIRDEQSAKAALSVAWNKFRVELMEMPEDQRMPVALWASVDRLKAA